jgi:RNA polymerase sigma factor (sigma-70 family)
MSADDADLVLAARSGDRAAWAGIYDRYADRLHDFCWSVLRDRDEAADAMHDTFITAYRRLDQLRDPSRLRSWLFAVARNEALSHARRRGRAVPTEELEVTATTGTPEDAAQTEELRALVWQAAAGLADRDRAALDLHLRQGLEGAALGEALGTSTSNANVVLSRLRDQVERSLGALLVARRGRADCAGLDGLLSGWDHEFTPLWRKRIARHVDDCPTCDERRRRMVSPLALLAGVAVVPAPAHMRSRVLDDLNLISASEPIGGATRAAARRSTRRRRAGGIGAVAAAVALLLGFCNLRGDDASTRQTRLATATTIGGLLPLPTLPHGDATTSTATGTEAPAGGTATTRKPVGTATTASHPPTTRPGATATTTLGATTTTIPIRVSARAGASSLCVGQQTTVTATVSGGSGRFTRVRLFTQGPGSTQTNNSMNPSGSGWTANLGPFQMSGTARWWVVATDSTGNSGQSAPQNMNVVVCPQ